MRTISEETLECYVINDIRIENILAQRYCVFDLEGTGLNTANDNIIQFGAVLVEKGEILSRHSLEEFVKPTIQIPESITKLTGITNADVGNSRRFIEVYKDFVDFSQGTILVTQCGFEYDFRMLKAECDRSSVYYAIREELDTKVMFSALHPEISGTFSTDFLINYYSIDTKDLKRHTAIGDCIIIARILICILNDYTMNKKDDIIIDYPMKIRKFVPKPLS